MYSHESIMPYGKHKFKRLKDIPADYFLNIFYNNSLNNDLNLFVYIKENLELLKEKSKRVFVPPPAPVFFVCNKITFPSEAEAKFKLKAIKKSPGNHKKPTRVYECSDCGGWHLTSKANINWLKKN